MALTDPPKDGESLEAIVQEEGALGQMDPRVSGDPLTMAKEDAQAAGRIRRRRSSGPRKVINLNQPRVSQSDGEVYLRYETRDLLSRVAYLMSCSYAETVRALSTLDYRPSKLVLLGRLPDEEIPKRNVRVRVSMDDATIRQLEAIAKKCHLGRARNTAAMTLDAILSRRVLPTSYESIEAAAEGLRRSPIAALQEMAEQLDAVDGRILLRLSPQAAQGIVAIMNDFNRRRDWRKVRFRRVIEALADLPVTYQLVGDIAALPRSQRPLVLPMWAVQKLAAVAMDNLLVSQPAFRRPSSLVSETLEYVGQGAIQLLHNRRGTDSLQTLMNLRGGKR